MISWSWSHYRIWQYIHCVEVHALYSIFCLDSLRLEVILQIWLELFGKQHTEIFLKILSLLLSPCWLYFLPIQLRLQVIIGMCPFTHCVSTHFLCPCLHPIYLSDKLLSLSSTTIHCLLVRSCMWLLFQSSMSCGIIINPLITSS